MSARPFAAFVLVALCALPGGIPGCLRVFGPDLRARGVHASVPSEPSDATQVVGACMSCHEAQADALARMQAGKPAPHVHDGELHTHAEPEPTPMTGPPLVADWMVADSRSCTDCHRVRP